MKRLIGVLAVALGLFAGVTPALAQERSVPHYFPDGIERLTQPAQQWEAYLRYMNATDICRGTHGADVTRYRDFSRSIQIERTYAGKKVTFFFEPWVRVGDEIVFYDFCGQRTVSKEQFDGVVADFTSEFERAVEKATDYYRDLEKRAVAARAKRIKNSEGQPISEEEFRKRLDTPVPDAPKVTYRELEQLPRPVTKADFVPREVHLGYSPYFGVAWLNTGIIWVTPQARIMDYIHGNPSVLMHEMTHANANLQSYPLSNGVDVELIASIPEMLLDEDHIALFYHGYMRDTRDMINVYFGFNFDQVRHEIVPFPYAGNLRVDTAKFNEHIGKLTEVRRELRKAFLATLEEYYSDQVFWTSFNEKMQDTRAVFRVMMSFNYDPTICGGHAKCMQFLKRNHDKIMRYAHQAFEKSGGADDDGSDGNRVPTQATIELLERATGMNRADMLKLAKKHGVSEKDLRDKTTPEILRLYLRLMETERNGVAGREDR